VGLGYLTAWFDFAISIIFAAAALLVMAGCQQPSSKNAWDKISKLEHERSDLKLEIEELQEQNHEEPYKLLQEERELQFLILFLLQT
jgi:hypothetical protein